MTQLAILPIMRLDRQTLIHYRAQARTTREQLLARWQASLTAALVQKSPGEFNRVIATMLVAAETNARLIGLLGDAAPGVQKGLRQTQRLIQRDLMKPALATANSKMGRILSFSVPPVLTCPEHTECAAECYALRLVYKRHSSWSTFQSYLRNMYLLHYYPDVVQQAILRRLKAARKPFTEFRLNVSGDVPNQAVADFWNETHQLILQQGVRAYGYTKTNVFSPSLLQSAFILDKTEQEAVWETEALITAGHVPALTGTIDQLKAVQRRVKGMVLCPELMAKHYQREFIPNCASCGLCSKAVHDRESGLRVIGFPLH